MRQNRRSAIANSGTRATTSEQVAKDIHRSTREHHVAEENIRTVLDRLRGEYSIAELCRRGYNFRPPAHLTEASLAPVAGNALRYTQIA